MSEGHVIIPRFNFFFSLFHQLLNFYEKVKDNLGTAQRSFKQAIEKTQANVYWMKHHYPKLESWLKHNAMSR